MRLPKLATQAEAGALGPPLADEGKGRAFINCDVNAAFWE